MGYEPHQEPPGGAGNTRNGTTPKTLITEHGKVADRHAARPGREFEPQIVRKRQRRFEGFDDKILALYSRGLSTRDIEAHLRGDLRRQGRPRPDHPGDRRGDGRRPRRGRRGRWRTSTRSCSSTRWC